MAITADAFMGIIIALMFFSLGVATTVVANRGKTVPAFSTNKNGEPMTSQVVVRDYPNIVFGSLFIVLGVTLFAMAVRAIMA
jgi:hypothetical protein